MEKSLTRDKFIHFVIFITMPLFMSFLPAKKQEDKQIKAKVFYVKKALNDGVSFWIKVFSKYSTNQGIIHDAKHLNVTYEIVDLSGIDIHNRNEHIKRVKEKWRKVLINVDHKKAKPLQMTSDELHVFKMFAKVNDTKKFIEASKGKRIRFQKGQKDQFFKALLKSTLFINNMEETLVKMELPKELARLPLVESSFNVHAHSKAGAKGVWQIMPETAKKYLKIDDVVDQRKDPVLSTIAAAKILKKNYKHLNSWPLAVLAYNHGLSGVKRAIKKTGTNKIEKIISDYSGRYFGFASRNFYLEFLAAIEVEKNSDHYFRGLKKLRKNRYSEVKLNDYIKLDDLLNYINLLKSEIKELNPALSPLVFKGKKRLPKGYLLRIPYYWKDRGKSAKDRFIAKYSKIPQELKFNKQTKGY